MFRAADIANKWFLTASVALAIFASANSACAKDFQVLYSFSRASGSFPSAALIRYRGNLYSTTSEGGANNQGTVFELAPNGTETVLHSFAGTDGSYPSIRLIADSNGNLYGTTLAGGTVTTNCDSGCGTIFKLDLATDVLTTLYSFTGGNDGAAPFAGLIADKDGNLYGTTYVGGMVRRRAPHGAGVVFELTRKGREIPLYEFKAGKDGKLPAAGLITDAAGNLYGTTEYGGANKGGTVFEIAPDGTESVLYSFCSLQKCADGYDPVAGLIMDAKGNLYGTTVDGGAEGSRYAFGTVFELSRSGGVWTEKVLYSFKGSRHDGAGPEGELIFDASGALYGTTAWGGVQCDGLYGCGSVFRLAPDGTEKVLHFFTGGRDGIGPEAALIADTKGRLYSTTATGGSDGYGTVFRLDARGQIGAWTASTRPATVASP